MWFEFFDEIFFGLELYFDYVFLLGNFFYIILSFILDFNFIIRNFGVDYIDYVWFYWWSDCRVGVEFKCIIWIDLM